MVSILSSLAESESTSISENNKWAVQKRFQNGTFKISYPPYGYENIDGQMVVNKEQAEIVRYIFSQALAGKGTGKIANALNNGNIPSKRGGKWSGTTIRGILVNEKYVGDALLQKTYTDSTGRNKYVAWTCNTHLTDKEECSMLFIRDEDIKNAFITMMNKLIFGKDFILKPLLNKLKIMSKSGNLSKIETLEKQIESNRKQQDLLVSLMAKKYLEPALFNKEKNELQMEENNLIEEKEGLIQDLNGELSKGQEVSNLIKYTNKTAMLTAFDDEAFTQHMDRIIVFSREEIGFVLKCGITLRERM